ncbi:hypothetical protein KKF34_05080 [Myxococcota bacterium]|nr:hypothetical protein [Myxococcota bacterium]MBU1379195.1 hypothetical protein [Myxococcota bacterium]MBU1496234.1 hypothetical protein [Myxococcota bacterium]
MSGHTTPESSWHKIRNMVITTWDAKKSDIHKDLLLTHGFHFSARKGVLSKCKARSTVYGGLTPVLKPSTHKEVETVWVEYPIDSSTIELVFECEKKEYDFKLEITQALKAQLIVIQEEIKKLIGAASEKTKKMEDLLDRTFPITPLATDGTVSKNVKKIIALRNATMVASFVLTMLDWQLNSLEKKKIAPTIFKIKLKRFAEKEYKYSRTKLVLIRRYIELAIKTNKKNCIKLRNRLKTMKNTEYEYGRLSRKYGHHCVIYDAAEKDLFEISPLFEFIEKRRKGWIKFEF